MNFHFGSQHFSSLSFPVFVVLLQQDIVLGMYIHKAHRFSCVKLILESNIGVQQQEQIVKERGFWDHQYKGFETTQECPKKSSSTLTLNTINVIFLQFSRPCHKHQPKEFLIFPHATLSLLQSSQFKHCTTFLVKKLP